LEVLGDEAVTGEDLRPAFDRDVDFLVRRTLRRCWSIPRFRLLVRRRRSIFGERAAHPIVELTAVACG